MTYHTFLHTAAIVSLVISLLSYVIRAVIDHNRGKVTVVRQGRLLFFGLCLLLVSILLHGGPHEDAADLLGLTGSVCGFIGAMALRRKATPPAA